MGFISYLSSRSFHVKCENELSSLHTSSYEVGWGGTFDDIWSYVGMNIVKQLTKLSIEIDTVEAQNVNIEKKTQEMIL